MSLPTISKTWQFQVNQQLNSLASGTLNRQNLFFSIKESLIGNGSWTNSASNAISSSSNWVVVGSSDASTSSLDGTDRIIDYNDFIFNTGAHSWAVLRQTGISVNFEICISGKAPYLTATDTGFGAINGGTDGSVTDRPTATSEITFSNFVSENTSTSENYRLHVLKSNDGSSTRIFVCSANRARSVVCIEKPGASVTGWANPFVVGQYSTTSNAASVILNFAALTPSGIFKGFQSTTLMNLQLSSEATLLTSNKLVPDNLNNTNAFNGGVSLFPIGVANTEASPRGRHGVLSDIWFGSAALQDGTSYPNDGTKQFVQMGVFIIPWNKTIPLLA